MTSSARVRAAVTAIREGVVVSDHADRENDGDVVFAAGAITPAQMAS
jgi:3,4-dihydroxy-2-butanone 4-phosphate synthase